MEYFIEQTLDYLKMVVGIFFILVAILFWADSQRLEMLNLNVVRLVDRVRYEGYITREMYEEFERKVSIFPCKINIQHISYNLNANAQRVWTVSNEKKIYDVIYSDEKIYKMSKGDDFIVYVTPLQAWGYKQLLRVLGGEIGAYEKPILRGGLIYNEGY